MDILKKLVSARLNSQVVAAHPDPELLAALAESSISHRDRSQVFDHLSGCHDCREVFYLALPETSESQQAFSNRRKPPRLAIRWATLAASVIILGSVVISNRGTFTEHTTQHSQVVTESSTSRDTAETKTHSSMSEPAKAPATQTLARLRPPAKHMTASPQASLQFDQSGEVHFAAAPSSSSAEQNAIQTTGQSTDVISQLKASRVASPVAITNALWRISPDGMPERSLDGAQSWQAVAVENGIQFRVINAVGSDVWVGGTAGNLYHSVDSGQSWSKVEPMTGEEKLQSDITKISFADSRNGLVSTANGGVWSTSDGGKNWQLK
jgi:Photosynthesis system II assembly factor YCF48